MSTRPNNNVLTIVSEVIKKFTKENNVSTNLKLKNKISIKISLTRIHLII